MKPIVISYGTKPERTQQNTRLIEGVFRDLGAKQPEGVRYLVLRFDDGSFVHVVAYEGEQEALTSLPAFQRFQQEAGEYRSDAPVRREAEVVGNYRMLSE